MTPEQLELAKMVGKIVAPAHGVRDAVRGYRCIFSSSVSSYAEWRPNSNGLPASVLKHDWVPDLFDGCTCGALQDWLYFRWAHVVVDRDASGVCVRCDNASRGGTMGVAHLGPHLGTALAMCVIATDDFLRTDAAEHGRQYRST